MRTSRILSTLAVFVVVAAPALAADPQVGTWKLNAGKSKISPGSPRNDTVVYTMVGDNMKVTVDGVDGSGKPAHNDWTGKFDGKDYPVTGDPAFDARSYTKVNDNTLALTLKKGGKAISTGRIVVAADGKSRTVTTTGPDAQGKVVTITAVYDKQ